MNEGCFSVAMTEIEMKLTQLAKARGSHFFDSDTMKYFKSVVVNILHETSDGFIFITSEKPPTAPRFYSVRYISKDSAGSGVVRLHHTTRRDTAIKWAAKEYAAVMLAGGATNYQHRDA